MLIIYTTINYQINISLWTTPGLKSNVFHCSLFFLCVLFLCVNVLVFLFVNISFVVLFDIVFVFLFLGFLCTQNNSHIKKKKQNFQNKTENNDQSLGISSSSFVIISCFFLFYFDKHSTSFNSFYCKIITSSIIRTTKFTIVLCIIRPIAIIIINTWTINNCICNC